MDPESKYRLLNLELIREIAKHKGKLRIYETERIQFVQDQILLQQVVREQNGIIERFVAHNSDSLNGLLTQLYQAQQQNMTIVTEFITGMSTRMHDLLAQTSTVVKRNSRRWSQPAKRKSTHARDKRESRGSLSPLREGEDGASEEVNVTIRPRRCEIPRDSIPTKGPVVLAKDNISVLPEECTYIESSDEEGEVKEEDKEEPPDVRNSTDDEQRLLNHKLSEINRQPPQPPSEEEPRNSTLSGTDRLTFCVQISSSPKEGSTEATEDSITRRSTIRISSPMQLSPGILPSSPAPAAASPEVAAGRVLRSRTIFQPVNSNAATATTNTRKKRGVARKIHNESSEDVANTSSRPHRSAAPDTEKLTERSLKVKLRR